MKNAINYFTQQFRKEQSSATRRSSSGFSAMPWTPTAPETFMQVMLALDDGKLPNYTATAIFKTLDYDPQFFMDLSDNNFEMISEICNPTAIEAWKREKNLRHLGVPSIIGSGNYKFNEKFYFYIITHRFADNLQQLLKNNKKGFILPTIYKVVGQMTHVLEYIHSLGYKNIFCLSSDKLLQSFTDPNNIYLDVIDYGKTPESFTFKSRDSQVGNACGDLESIMYMVFNWMKLRVPWSNLMDDVAVNTQKEKAFNDIEKFLKTVFGKYRVLAPIQKFMKVLASTVNNNKPDYNIIRLCISEGIRNIRNINHNLDGGIDFKAELQLRKKKAKYVRSVFNKACTTIQRGAKRNAQQAKEPTVSRRFKKMKVVSTESFEKKTQQQLTTSSAVSKIMNDTSSSEPEKNITRMDNEILGECTTKVDDSLQRTKDAIRAIRPLNAESEMVSLQMKDFEKKFEQLESALSSYDALLEPSTKEPKTLDNIQAVKNKLLFHQKALKLLRCQFIILIDKAHKHKIAITELWNKICCVDFRMKEIEDILDKCGHALSVASSQTKKQETSTESTNLITLVREEEKSRPREEEKPKNKSNEKSNCVRVTMERNSVETVTRKPERQKGQIEMNEKNAKLHDGLNRVENIGTRLNEDSQEIKKSRTKNANEEDLERVLRAFKMREGISITRVEKKK